MTDEFRAEDDHLLDLLVDGELSDSQRRAVLAWCEHQPDGWRRCALTFLEAQSWGKELGWLARNDVSGDFKESGVRSQESGADRRQAAEGRRPSGGGSHPHVESAIRNPQSAIASTRAPRSFLAPLAMAASFVLAFTLGMLIRGGWLSTHDGARTLATAPDDGARSDDEPVTPRGLAGGRAQRPLDNVRLVWDGPQGTAETIELPVVEGQALDENWLRSQPPALPADLLQALERSGHHVEQRRELVPLNMRDGRRLVVPVDQVEVQPVGNRRAYQ